MDLSGTTDLRPKLAGMASAVHWLRSRGIPVERLAWVLQTDCTHIRQLAFRGRGNPLRFYVPSASLSGLLARPPDAIRKRLNVRPHEDYALLSLRQRDRIDSLRNEIQQIVVDSSPFLDRLARLRKLRQFMGYVSGVERLRLMAFLHQQMAWLRVHSGLCSSAFLEARIAVDLSHIAYSEREQPQDLRQLTESCLIASNACLLACDRHTAIRFLDLARDASERIRDPRGSEHYRQFAVACFQGGDDECARRNFNTAVGAMQAKMEAENEAHILIIGVRHTALLAGTVDFEQQLRVLEQVERDYPRNSLQRVMALNFAAACGLILDSSPTNQCAQEMLQQSLALSPKFGHQATVAKLLALTPALGLDPSLRSDWIRRALYDNAFKNR